MMDAGHIRVCRLENVQMVPGGMPVEALVLVTEADFEERTLGVTRAYLAKGANEQIDLLARIWRDPLVKVGMYAVVSDSDYNGQYRVTMVQHSLDGDNLKVTDISLSKMGNNYAVATE